MTEGVTGSRFNVGMWVVYEDRDRAYDVRAEVENPLGERTQIRVPLVTLDLRLTERLGVQVAGTFPNVTRTAALPRPTGPFNFSETFSGLGDTSVLTWYRLRPIKRWYAIVNAGLSLPTGKTETPRFRPELANGNLVPVSRLQRGSGTVDPLIGASVNRRLGAFTFFNSAAARLPVTENDVGLRTGQSAEFNTGVARALGTHRVTGFARLGWLHREQDVFLGTPVLVGGGDWVYLTPGIAAQVGKGINVQAEVKFPILRTLANRQLDSSAVFQFGISRAF
ncbi:MAG: hypothetical protein ACT4QD_06825 [Acidobacteriota bacterium]